MAHYNASLDTSRPPDEMFAYLSDFSSTQEWDPGVIEAERLGEQPVREGTEFRLLASFLGRKIPLTYRIVEYDPPSAVTFRGESSTVVSLDRITFEPSERGTRITYDADLALKGPFKLADPLLGSLSNASALARSRACAGHSKKATEHPRASPDANTPSRFTPSGGSVLSPPATRRTSHSWPENPTSSTCASRAECKVTASPRWLWCWRRVGVVFSAQSSRNASVAATSRGRANRKPWPLSQSSSLQQRELLLLLDALGEGLDRERLAELHERVDQRLALLVAASAAR